MNMNKKLVERLHLELEPVSIFFGNTTAKSELEANPEKRNRIVPFLMAAVKGKIASMDEAGCTCPGGAVGACLGDGFTRLDPNIHVTLSQGLGNNISEVMPPHRIEMMSKGERFFLQPRVTMQSFHNGKALNTIAPYGAACHSIVYTTE